MRRCESTNYWRNVYKRKYKNYIKSITLSDCLGFTGTVPFYAGITAICGLNGVGKSTLVSCVKKAVGLGDDSIFTQNKACNEVSAELILDGKSVTIHTSDYSSEQEVIFSDQIKYIDSNQSIELLKLWSEQTNLDEYLEELESQTYEQKELEEISELVGKSYTKCISIETQEDTTYKQVYFQVSLDDQDYSSPYMGLGEHFLMYLYYIIQNAAKDSCIIIEEPETYISVKSQYKLMDFIAKTINKKGISFIITTHSPHILESIHDENILIISSMLNKMKISNAKDVSIDVKQYLGIGTNHKFATIFVEDKVARLFIETVIKDELPHLNKQVEIVSVNGESDITARLKFDDSAHISHKFIGIYDGDMRNTINTNEIKWPFLFLPIQDCVEKEMYRFLKSEAHINKLINELHLSIDRLSVIFNQFEGEEYHEWFIDISREIGFGEQRLIEAFYYLWKSENADEIASFIDDLSNCLVLNNAGRNKKALTTQVQ